VKRINEHRPSILLVDNSGEFRKLLRYSLSLDNYDILEAEDGKQAIEIAQRERPDLILMDLRIPVLNGIAATRLIRADPRVRHIPIVICTGLDPYLFREASLSVGATDFISKPIQDADLRALLSRYLLSSKVRPLHRQKHIST
jgi:CheY-like chemotaxis protein